MKEKLVRDRFEIRGGKAPVLRKAENREEYRAKLREKLIEEAEEFKKDESPEEMADMLEVIDALIGEYNFDLKKLMELKRKKRATHGGFGKRLILKIS